jgi:hypothetical protein
VLGTYDEAIADATRHGFNIVTDRWRIVTLRDAMAQHEATRPNEPGASNHV